MVAQRPFFVGRPGWVRSRAWIWLFSSRLQHDGVGGSIDIETDHLLELVGEFGIVGALERAHPMGLQPVPLPDASHRREADPNPLGQSPPRSNCHYADIGITGIYAVSRIMPHGRALRRVNLFRAMRQFGIIRGLRG